MAMCRLNKVEKARNDQGNCGKCGQPIKAGDSYRWWKGRYTGKRVRCSKPSCTPQLYELETNPLRAEAMQAEDAVSSCQGAEDAGTAAEFLREAIRAHRKGTEMQSTWVVVWYDPEMHIDYRGQPHLQAEDWRNQSTAEAVAATYRARGQRAWVVELKGEGKGRG